MVFQFHKKKYLQATVRVTPVGWKLTDRDDQIQRNICPDQTRLEISQNLYVEFVNVFVSDDFLMLSNLK